MWFIPYFSTYGVSLHPLLLGYVDAISELELFRLLDVENVTEDHP
jgi:hypothetical protein